MWKTAWKVFKKLNVLKSRVKVKVAQSCPTLCNPKDCSPPGSPVHRILQARTLGWVAISSSRGIFPTQGSNQGLPHGRWILYHLSHQGKPQKPYDPVIPLPALDPEKKISFHNDTYTSVFRATRFTTSKTLNQPKCPSTE